MGAVDGLKQTLLELSAPDADGVYRGGAAKRKARTQAARAALGNLWQEAVEAVPFDVPREGIGFAAVGSLARGQIGPRSDLDLTIIVQDSRVLSTSELNELANRLWYPLWDAGIDLDHSVRSKAQCEAVTDHDVPAAMGWLDVMPIAGDAALVESTGASILQRWRKMARKRLPELLETATKRQERFGRLAYVNQPDIKESRGGLRDTVLASAIAASWLADRPHGRYDDAVERLLDVRDAIHLAAGKDTNLLLSPYQAPVAAMLGLADPTLPDGERQATSIDDLQTLLARLGRAVAFGLDSTASRAQRTLVHDKPRFSFFQMRKPQAGGKREAPKFDVVAPGVAVHEQEVVLAPGAQPQEDAQLPLRVAVAAARRGMPINAATLSNLRRAPVRSNGWDGESRTLFVQLLASGANLLDVWEELDFIDMPGRWMPEWSAIRNRPSASAAHRFTIDRHMVEVTSRLGRVRPTLQTLTDVPLPVQAAGWELAGSAGAGRSGVPGGGSQGAGVQYSDDEFTALLLAGILHDIGKRPGVADHASEGVRHAKVILERMGFEPGVTARVLALVREHLSMSQLAQSKPAAEAGALLAERLEGDVVLLDMLFDLTRADMCSLGATAGESISGQLGWSKWHAQLVAGVYRAARQCMEHE